MGRTVYNQIVGDTPLIKKQLVDYCRDSIQIKNPKFSPLDIDIELALHLSYIPRGEKINPLEVSIEKLWDASEVNARN